MKIKQTILKFHNESKNKLHHRYRSWEHCYQYFRQRAPDNVADDRTHAALQLGFYLASWGMYRGSSFLLQHTYTVHEGVIDLLVEDRFKPLWEHEYGTGDFDTKLGPLIMEAVNAIKTVYKPFVDKKGSQQPTDTLVSKIILGTFGCLPACDRFFIDGFKKEEDSFSCINKQFIDRISVFCANNIDELYEVQIEIEEKGFRYPMMKLVDMYFWQIGYDLDRQKSQQRGQTTALSEAP
jgi:hypothetical protein